MASPSDVVLKIVVFMCSSIPLVRSKSSGFDLDKFEEKLGGYLPTSTSVALIVIAALVALKVKKLLFLIGLLVLSKILTSFWSFMGHKCPYKPVYIKEDEFYLQEEPHYHHHRSFSDRLLLDILNNRHKWSEEGTKKPS